MMKYKPFTIDDIKEVLKMFHYEHLKYCSGSYPEKKWIGGFIENGYARGLFNNEGLKAALIAEPLLNGGVYLWIIAVSSEDIGKGYGQILYDCFEKEMRNENKSWIFLTSFYKSENFYKRNGFKSTNLMVKEMSKNLK